MASTRVQWPIVAALGAVAVLAALRLTSGSTSTAPEATPTPSPTRTAKTRSRPRTYTRPVPTAVEVPQVEPEAAPADDGLALDPVERAALVTTLRADTMDNVRVHLQEAPARARAAIDLLAPNFSGEDVDAARAHIDALEGELEDVQDQLDRGKLDPYEAAEAIAEIQQDAYHDVLGTLKGKPIHVPLLKAFAPPTAPRLDDEP
jgi:hypothetical protein